MGALIWLAVAGCLAALVYVGTGVFQKWQSRPEALIEAVKSSDEATLHRLIKQSGKGRSKLLEFTDPQGDTALIWAVRLGSRQICRALLEAGADPNAKTQRGTSPLHEAAIAGHKEISILLLQFRAREGRDRALIWAAIHSADDLLKLLLEKGADPNTRGEKDTTALMHAAAAGSADSVNRLLARGASVKLVDAERRTALSYAADTGNVRIVQALLKRGADVNARDSFGRTALGRAKERRHQAVVHVLAAAGGKP